MAWYVGTLVWKWGAAVSFGADQFSPSIMPMYASVSWSFWKAGQAENVMIIWLAGTLNSWNIFIFKFYNSCKTKNPFFTLNKKAYYKEASAREKHTSYGIGLWTWTDKTKKLKRCDRILHAIILWLKQTYKEAPLVARFRSVWKRLMLVW